VLFREITLSCLSYKANASNDFMSIYIKLRFCSNDRHIFSFSRIDRLHRFISPCNQTVRISVRTDINYDATLRIIDCAALVFPSRGNLSSTNARCIFISVRAFRSREYRLHTAETRKYAHVRV